MCSRRKPAPPRSSPDQQDPILGVEGLDYRLGGCCSPLPGEAILGTVALGNHGITVHRQDCSNVVAIPSERRLPVRWNPALVTRSQRFPAQLRIEVIDRVGILKDILMRLSDGRINVSDARVKTSHGKPARIDLRLELASAEQLQRTMHQIRSMADVIDIARSSGT
nr:ACT domain-containing protein [Synechococcus sp. UW179A]